MNVLCTVAVITLGDHHGLSNLLALLVSAETNDVSKARVCLLVTVSDAHATSDCDIKACQLAIPIDDGDETQVVRKYIDVIGGRNGDGNFELVRSNESPWIRKFGEQNAPSSGDRTPRRGVRHP